MKNKKLALSQIDIIAAELGDTQTKMQSLRTTIVDEPEDASPPPVEPPPPPPPVEPPPSPVEKLVRAWKAVREWRIRWPSRLEAIVEMDYQGRRAIKMAVLYSDHSPGGTTTTTRAQLETDSVVKEGEIAFFRGRFFLPKGFTAPGWGVNITELYAEKGDGSPPWQIQVRGDRIQVRYLGGELLWDAPLADYVGRWVTYAIGTAWQTNGWLEMHIDDLSGDHPAIPRRSVFKSVEIPNAPAGTPKRTVAGSFYGPARFIIQCYYPTSTNGPNITLYHENEVVMGRSLESVR